MRALELQRESARLKLAIWVISGQQLIPVLMRLNVDNGHREGRFERIASLELQAICGPELFFSTESVVLGSPECAGNVNTIELSTGMSITAGAL
jgi:hypothetical protein